MGAAAGGEARRRLAGRRWAGRRWAGRQWTGRRWVGRRGRFAPPGTGAGWSWAGGSAAAAAGASRVGQAPPFGTGTKPTALLCCCTSVLLHCYTTAPTRRPSRSEIAPNLGVGVAPKSPTPSHRQAWGANARSPKRLTPWQVECLVRPHEACPRSPLNHRLFSLSRFALSTTGRHVRAGTPRPNKSTSQFITSALPTTPFHHRRMAREPRQRVASARRGRRQRGRWGAQDARANATRGHGLTGRALFRSFELACVVRSRTEAHTPHPHPKSVWAGYISMAVGDIELLGREGRPSLSIRIRFLRRWFSDRGLCRVGRSGRPRDMGNARRKQSAQVSFT